ncbi:hypothetical protein HN51_038007 [Arachis hypogaea]|uniref:Transmembrane protein n=2 Tax=Arachis TaxID=3817 RepID=A0A444ZTL9_ARAHY|nr:uncharacterized protein LOC107481815 [Arachis duranensis]XP_025691116.1 uncharacterized protein LOC112792194 [Arachis hypogaea]XP_025691117.1 uncharacterized protein LOC112792194 [Arachis hypogaea]QHO03646.1 uncharacterized protein DS421_13g433930 [Arachis hypogaea]RYR17571.1 hypothetical protein Ahy_B03g062276 isoform D [Arachis hypogaea]
MLLTFTPHLLLARSPSTHHSLYFAGSCNLSRSIISLRSRHHFPILHLNPSLPFKPSHFTFLATRADAFNLAAYDSDGALPKHAAGAGGFDFDYFLSLIEFSCLLSSAFASVCVAVVAGLKKELLAAIGSKAAVWGTLALVFGVLSGAWIRRRQWRRVCRETVKDGLEVNLLQRIEKLEEDLRSTSAISRVLSRELEKLAIRFRVTRKTLKEPVTETAVLAQKNSEAARALAVQSDILEKEMVEIQQVLLAMQEQQRRQLDLILAIGKTGKLQESKLETREENDTLETSNSVDDEVKQEVHPI